MWSPDDGANSGPATTAALQPVMGVPATILPDQYEILATRVVRGAGLVIEHPRVLERSEPDDPSADYTVRLTTKLRTAGSGTTLLLECRRNTQPIPAEALDALADRFRDFRVIVFATGGYDTGALARASTLGMVLYRVVDAKADYEGWGYTGQAPAWLPEFTAERVAGPELSG
jgi:hypothetical protein